MARRLLPVSRVRTIPSHDLHKLLRNNLIHPLTWVQLIIPEPLTQAAWLCYTVISSRGITQIVLTCDIRWALQILLGVVVDVRE